MHFQIQLFLQSSFRFTENWSESIESSYISPAFTQPPPLTSHTPEWCICYNWWWISLTHYYSDFTLKFASLVTQAVKNLSAMRETWVHSLGWEDSLEKRMATQSSILAWRITWTEEPGGLQSMVSWRVGHDWVTNTHSWYCTFCEFGQMCNGINPPLQYHIK